MPSLVVKCRSKLSTLPVNKVFIFAAGHHATERYGIKALGEWLSQHYDLEVEFKDIDNPA